MKLKTTLNNITNNLPLKDPAVALNDNDLVPKTTPSNYNKNIMSSNKGCFILQVVKDKDDCASIPVNSTKINEQLTADNKSVNNLIFLKKPRRSEVSDENCTINDV